MKEIEVDYYNCKPETKEWEYFWQKILEKYGHGKECVSCFNNSEQDLVVVCRHIKVRPWKAVYNVPDNILICSVCRRTVVKDDWVWSNGDLESCCRKCLGV